MKEIGHGLPCTYCNRAMQTDVEVSHPLYATRDHYFPRSKNNGNPNKKVWACYQCNQIKADRTPEQWDRFMLHNPRWWAIPTWNEDHRATAAKLPPPIVEKVPPLPLDHTKYILTHGKKAYKLWVANGCQTEPALRPLRKDEPIPINFVDPGQQAAFESVYKNRKWLLRVSAATTPS